MMREKMKPPIVAELIAELRKCKPTALVFMACDPEGNGFSPMAQISPDRINVETHEPEEGGDDNCIILWPTD